MLLYRVRGIPDTVAAAVRSSLLSPQYGHPAHAEMATGYGPCRLCLHTFNVGTEERLLFTYQPFTDPTALPAPGPVFIHRAPCDRYDAPGLPEALRPLPLVEAVLDEVFGHPEARYAHLRNAEAGCFIARVDQCSVCD